MRKLSVALVLTLALLACVAAVAIAGTKSSSDSGGNQAESHYGRGSSKASDQYPECTPYFSEGTGAICRLNKIDLQLTSSCSFGSRSGSCSGVAATGSFPWGTAGSGGRNPKIYMFWKPSGDGDGRTLEIDTLRDTTSGYLIAKIVGYVPRSNSSRYSITEAIAGNDLEYPNGNKFYTPDLPGQEPGQPGGPLYLNFDSHRVTADVYIDGNLYLAGP